MSSTATAALHRVRASSLIDAIGLLLVAALLLWLLVKFFQDPTRFLEVSVIGLTVGATYGLIALGYTLVYGILQLINFAHGDVFTLSGLVAFSIITWLGLDTDTSVPVIVGGLLLVLLVTMPGFAVANAADRANRVQAAPPRPPARSVDHGGRGLLHPPKRRSRRVRAQLPHDPRLHPADGRDLDPRRRRSSGTSSQSSRS